MKRISCVKVYFTEEEAELLRQRAGLASLSAYVRSMALSLSPNVRFDRDIVTEPLKAGPVISKVGTKSLTVQWGRNERAKQATRKREKADKKAKLQGTRCPHGMAIVDGLTGCSRCNS